MYADFSWSSDVTETQENKQLINKIHYSNLVKTIYSDTFIQLFGLKKLKVKNTFS